MIIMAGTYQIVVLCVRISDRVHRNRENILNRGLVRYGEILREVSLQFIAQSLDVYKRQICILQISRMLF